jgi:hypothetical protein
MRYEKPFVATLGIASVAIQHLGINKVQPDTDGSAPNQRPSSGSSYDLDE